MSLTGMGGRSNIRVKSTRPRARSSTQFRPYRLRYMNAERDNYIKWNMRLKRTSEVIPMLHTGAYISVARHRASCCVVTSPKSLCDAHLNLFIIVLINHAHILHLINELIHRYLQAFILLAIRLHLTRSLLSLLLTPVQICALA
jgi:hypothetical protein